MYKLAYLNLRITFQLRGARRKARVSKTIRESLRWHTVENLFKSNLLYC